MELNKAYYLQSPNIFIKFKYFKRQFRRKTMDRIRKCTHISKTMVVALQALTLN